MYVEVESNENHACLTHIKAFLLMDHTAAGGRSLSGRRVFENSNLTVFYQAAGGATDAAGSHRY